MCSQTRYWQVTGLGPEQAEFLHRRFSWEKKTFVKVSSFKRGGCDAGARNWNLTIKDAWRLGSACPGRENCIQTRQTSAFALRPSLRDAFNCSCSKSQSGVCRVVGVSSVFVKLPVAELLSVEGNTEEGKKFAAHGEA